MATRQIHDYPSLKRQQLWTLHEAACYLAGVPVLGRVQVVDVHSTKLVKRIYDDFKQGRKLGRFKTYPPVLPEIWIGAHSGEPRALVEFAATRCEVVEYEIPSELHEWVPQGLQVDTGQPARPKHSRADLLSTEIEQAIGQTGADDPAAIMGRLRSYAGKPGSCITEAGVGYVLWRDAKGERQKLTRESLRKRLARRSDRTNR